MSHHQVLIIGGGTADIMVAALLCKEKNAPQVTIIDPSRNHYYQPLWTLVGAGVFPREESEREMGDYIPEGAEWLQQKVTSFNPDNHAVMLFRCAPARAGLQ